MQIAVRNIGRHAEGYWIAEAGVIHDAPEGELGTIIYHRVHRKFGSWMHGHGAEMREVRREAAAELQSQVRKLEKRERQAA